jgi:hypothetical protein
MPDCEAAAAHGRAGRVPLLLRGFGDMTPEHFCNFEGKICLSGHFKMIKLRMYLTV